MDSRRSAAGSTRKAVELPVETDIENLMGPGADSAPGPSFARRKPHGLPSPLCVLNFSAPAAHRASSLREALWQYAGRTWSGFSFTSPGLPPVRADALGSTGSALINNNDPGRLQPEMHKLNDSCYHITTVIQHFQKKRSPKAVGPQGFFWS